MTNITERPIRVLYGHSTNPYINLAVENWIFRDMPVDQHILYLWRNRETVVIGRFQNPWSECDLARMEEDKVLLARRQSGGGAVYHDLGNTNFTFMGAKDRHDKKVNFELIIRALSRFGIKAYTSGRNDLLVDDAEGPKKVSGSAFKNSSDRSFHHGTMLINANMQKLANYLRPNPKKLQSKGIQSVRSRVANLQEFNAGLTHEKLCQGLIEAFFEHYQTECPIENLGEAEALQIPAVNEYARQLEDWHWRIGETPRFMQTLDERFEWGGMEIHLDGHKGLITRAQVFSDSLFPDMIEDLGRSLQSQAYGPDGADRAIQQVMLAHPHLHKELEEVRSWLARELQ